MMPDEFTVTVSNGHVERMENGHTHGPPKPLSKKLDFDDHAYTGIKGLKGDWSSLALLTFLYILQGIPMGLAGAIPYLLQNREVNYKDQALFSLVNWPFSMKLLWAPVVDAVYYPRFGRRKCWLIPTQYILGVFMLLMASHMKALLGEEEGPSQGHVQIVTLTVLFFILNFLAATQDIAVDGWALTMLARKNVGWASTSNMVGQTAGFFIGYVVFLTLESADLCNQYFRSQPQNEGIVTLGGFLKFWGITFLITTSAVMLIKREKAGSEVDSEHGIMETYWLLWKIIKLPAVRSLMLIYFTMKVGFAAADAVTGLKLIQGGVPRDRLALLGIPIVPIQIILPLVISRYTAGPRPIDVLLTAMPYRLAMGIVFAVTVWWAPSTMIGEGVHEWYLYVVVVIVYGMHQVTLYSMYTAGMAFNARVSDPVIGGTYMTLLNTISNLGGVWPNTVALWAVDILTWKGCSGALGTCYPKAETCQAAGGKCVTSVDGYYIESVLCVFIGFAWLRWQATKARKLQDLGPDAWKCR